MSHYSYPFRKRVKLARSRFLSSVVDCGRMPIRRNDVLLLTGEASEAKILEVESRLRFIFSYLGSAPRIHRSRKASTFAYLRNIGVGVVDATAVPAFVRRHIRWVFDLDYEMNSEDGWALMDFGTVLSGGDLKSSISKGREIFVDRVRQLEARGPRPVYLFGTGPSLRLADQRSFSDGITVVCNTIVRDPDLWHHLNPDFFAAGDAIYHFGHTEHARVFRADALRRLQESNGRTLFVYPAPYDFIVRPEFRSVEQVLVPIPWGEHTDISVDLVSRFTLPKAGNVLNNLLLPLGCTLGTDIRLCGFDGRAPDDTGFWSYAARRAYPELIQSIRDAHPAFFDVHLPTGNEFSDVNMWHGEWLDERLTDAEGRGFRFQMLHPSWTATLHSRYVPGDSNPDAPAEHVGGSSTE